MAKQSITEVSANNTFQVWLDKTNEIVDLVKSDIMTASLSTANGDITIGNATLLGSFTANTVTADTLIRVDTISPKVGSSSITSTAPVNITTNQVVLETLTSTSGPRLSLTDTSDTWQIGFENSITKNFQIIHPVSGNALSISSNGNATLTGSFTAASFTGNLTGNVTGNLNGTVTGAINGTVSSLSNHTTSNLAEGSNLYFTTARARSSISASGALSYNPSTGVMTTVDSVIRSLFSGGTGISYSSSTGVISATGTSVAESAAKLETARQINGTLFDGTANITTATWGTSRTITVGSTSKNVNGSSNVSWSLSEIGAVSESRTITAGTGLLGGGDLSTNRTISADFATGAEGIAGTSTTKIMNPAATAQAIASRITTSAVTSATAAAAVGAVGTYAFLVDLTGTTSTPGKLVGAANLRYTGVGVGSIVSTASEALNGGHGGSPPSGSTWRCMGYAAANGLYGGTDPRENATLWLRVS